MSLVLLASPRSYLTAIAWRKKAHSARNFSTSATLSCILDTVMMKMLLLLLLLLGAVRDDDDDDDDEEEEEEEEEEIALGY